MANKIITFCKTVCSIFFIYIVLYLLGFGPLYSAFIDLFLTSVMIATAHPAVTILPVVLIIRTRLQARNKARGRLAACEFVSFTILQIKNLDIPLPSAKQFISWMDALITDPEKYSLDFPANGFSKDRENTQFSQGYNEVIDQLWTFVSHETSLGNIELQYPELETFILYLTHNFSTVKTPTTLVDLPHPKPQMYLQPDSNLFRIEAYIGDGKKNKIAEFFANKGSEPLSTSECLYCGHQIPLQVDYPQHSGHL